MPTAAIGSAVESVVHALVWWGALVAIGAPGWLAVRRATAQWHDAGWAIARPLAVCALAYAVWVAAHLAPLFRADVAWLLALGALIVLLAWPRTRPQADPGVLRRIGMAELRFAVPFAFYLAMRGLSHDIVGLEKFMDFAFVNAALNAATVPVADPWFAGEPINYYYFGHFVTAFLARFSGTPPAFAYNLMLATLFAFTFQLAYAIVAELTPAARRATRGAMALVAGAWLTLGGNVHGFAYGFVRPWLVDAGVVAPPRQTFLLSDPTRFVGWDPPTADKLIHEFPAYSFYVGDLHAHLLNLPAVLLLIALLLLWFRASAAGSGRAPLLACAWLVGVFAMSNSWDAVMYCALLGAILVARLVGALRAGVKAAGRACADGVLAALVTAATALPFLLHFRVGSEGFALVHSRTPLWQWLVLYGVQAALAVAGAIAAWRLNDAPLGGAERRVLAWLVAAGIAFALVPEVVYLKDIYGADFYRANTAFKFGFQAFTLLTLCACAGVTVLLARPRLPVPRLAAVLAFELVLVPPLYYSWFVLQGGFGVWQERTWTLDGQRFLAASHPEDRAAIAWLRAQGGAGPLVEAPGDSYSFGARISAHSGVPAVLGWPVHEQLWRGSDPAVWQRRDDVDRLYRARTRAEALAVVERYRPRWLVVGRFERERYPALDAALLAGLGRVAFRAGETFIVDLAATAPR